MGEAEVRWLDASIHEGVGCTHELIPDELFPFLVLSFGGDHRSVSFEYPL
jgi:hypothetical protein